MRVAACLYLVLLAPSLEAQGVRVPVLSSLYHFSACKDTPGVFSWLANPAMLPHILEERAAMASERRYMLKELGHHMLAACLPLRLGAFGFAGALSGNADMQERLLQLGYGRVLGKGVSLGLSFGYFSRQTRGYAGTGMLTWEAGLRFRCTPAFLVGLQVFQPAGGSSLEEDLNRIPAAYGISAGFSVSEPVFIGLQMEKRAGGAGSIAAGLHYQLSARMGVSAGISTATASYFLSVALQWYSFLLRVSAALHPVLGYTPGSSIHYIRSRS